MITIDKTDSLYKYLTALGVNAKDLNSLYLELAQNGRFKRKDVKTYFYADFQPSAINDLKEEELEPVIDYYADLKKLKQQPKALVKQKLLSYAAKQDKQLLAEIQTAYLKDVLFMCINFKTLHKNVDLQDLVQTANIGLLTAIKKYNPKNKIDINDYIVFWIRQKIKEEFKEQLNG